MLDFLSVRNQCSKVAYMKPEKYQRFAEIYVANSDFSSQEF